MGLFKAIGAGVIVAVLVVFMSVFFAGADALLDSASSMIASALGVHRSTEFTSAANTALGAVVWVVALIIAGVMLIYGIHIRRR